MHAQVRLTSEVNGIRRVHRVSLHDVSVYLGADCLLAAYMDYRGIGFLRIKQLRSFCKILLAEQFLDRNVFNVGVSHVKLGI